MTREEENRQRIAELEIRTKLDRHLRPTIQYDLACDLLLDQTPHGREVIAGSIPADYDELAAELRATPMGEKVMELVRDRIDSEAAAKTTTDEARLREIEAISNPQLKINAFRAYERERNR